MQRNLKSDWDLMGHFLWLEGNHLARNVGKLQEQGVAPDADPIPTTARTEFATDT